MDEAMGVFIPLALGVLASRNDVSLHFRRLVNFASCKQKTFGAKTLKACYISHPLSLIVDLRQ